MATLKYRHTDGTGRTCDGMTAEELASQPWCSEVFGELEREMLANEQVNPTTGAIEPIPPTPEELSRMADIVDCMPRLKEIYSLTPHDYRAGLAAMEAAEAIAQLADDVHKLTTALSLVCGEIRKN
jgi:hypothetical protein